MHVLKGAVVEVRGQAKFTSASRGVLRIVSDAPISPEDVSRIEAAANRKVAEDVDILEFEMESGEAESHFGRGIYDLGLGSSASGMVRIARIPDWDASCCSLRHVETTGAIGVIKIDSADYDGPNKQVELRFHVL